MYCPLRDGRPGGAIGWAKLDDGKFMNPADGGCNGGEANQKKWTEWLSKGYTSNKDAEAAGEAQTQYSSAPRAGGSMPAPERVLRENPGHEQSVRHVVEQLDAIAASHLRLVKRLIRELKRSA